MLSRSMPKRMSKRNWRKRISGQERRRGTQDALRYTLITFKEKCGESEMLKI
jgi:hypothetical protein